MSSRLDRLFVLLESGSSAPTRRAAAKQLGEVQRLHPHELHSLLRRIKKLLHSATWETRVAAGQAVAAIVASLPPWDPQPAEDGAPHTPRPHILDRFDISSLLSRGAQLTGSEGSEYDLEGARDTPAINSGVSASQAFGVDLDGILTDEDFILSSETKASVAEKRSVGEMVETEIFQAGGQSSRERNKARRRAKLRPLEIPKPELDGEEPRRKRSRMDTPSSASTPVSTPSDDENILEAVPDGTGSWVNANEWPLQGFCDDLLTDLFSPRWETRHGAATALREVIIGHGSGAGRNTPATKAQMESDHEAWLQDAALRVLSVLCLDRFGDFVSDTVVAPVRETCAQVLGALFKLLTLDSVHGVLTVIEQMCQQAPWETRHGALLALKYCLSVRRELVGEVLSKALPLAAARLYDDIDDVSGVAAAALVPVAADIGQIMADQIPDLVKKLWSLLADQDDLAAASHAFMGLLAALLNSPTANGHLEPHSLDDVLPRLWPFIGHSSSSVRKSTLNTLDTLTSGSVNCSTNTLQVTLRHLYQRALIEPLPDLLQMLSKAWGNVVNGSPSHELMEAVCPWFGTWLCLAMQHPKLPFDHSFLLPTKHTEGQILYLGGGEGPAHIMGVRLLAARMLGQISKRLLEGDLDGPDSPLPYYVNIMVTHLNSRSYLQRLMCGLVLTELHRLRQVPLEAPDLNAKVLTCAMEQVPFEEVSGPLSRLLADARDLIGQLPAPRPPIPTTLEDAVALATRPVPPALEERRASFEVTAEIVKTEQNGYSTSAQAALAGSLVYLKNLGDRLSPIVRPIMHSVRCETSELLQKESAEHLALIVSLCVNRTPCPNGKIISNLRAFISEEFPPCKSGDILTSVKQQRDAERASMKRQNSMTQRGPGRPPTVQPAISPLPDPAAEQKEEDALVQRRGAALALQAMARKSGADLPTLLPALWSIVLPPEDGESLPKQDLMTNLLVLEAVVHALAPSLLPQVLDRISALCSGICSDQPALRHTASRAFAALSKLSPERVMLTIVKQVLPLLNSTNLCQRAGAAEVITCIITALELNILPYTVLLLVPLLGRMTDGDPGVRALCTQSFASLVQIMPLDGPHLDTSLLAAEQAQERVFLKQLLNPTSIPDFTIPVPVNAQLRAYQQAGVNWLAFLNKYKLHGILCDDMGLGKTLQTICMLAAAHTETASPSLVICPPTLTGHWVAEVEKFVDIEHLQPLLYAGSPLDRERLRRLVSGKTLVVASYDIVRKDVDFFKTVPWNYCVLDEGHIIKNGKTKASKAIKTLTASHRLILSGTPIQNNVLELWSLFDFLMPGFLGSERHFNIKYGRPIVASRDAKVSSKEQEAGAMAMESLHRQVLPFLLRRVKEDVLKDLPPRITQDYVCELSPLQQLLYEDFSKSQAHHDLEQSISNSNSHIFQALRYLQNVCNHPQLVLTAQHPQYEKIQRMLSKQNSTMDDISHACKLPALKQLLLDCGIGVGGEAPMSQHRALIFCQLKAMLDVVQRLLTQHLPNVSFLRLDGTVPPLQRHGVVHKFNTDPTIDVLLLTTHVGGLGLNLTGADTVIFVEHDWNPMKDLQAMDRAHRIGQKKVVNVYRLITKGTLEEKIMGLQKFKLMTANTVISQKNSAMETMATEGILDLFTLQNDSKKGKDGSGRSILDSLPDLSEQNQYAEEYDLSAFVSQLSR